MENSEEGNWWHTARHERIVGLLAPMLRGKCLEIGPGRGRVGEWVSGKCEYHAIEADGNSAALLRKAGLAVKTGTAERLPYRDSSFDLFLAFDVLEHLEHDRRAIAEAARVLKPGGILIGSVPVCKGIFSSHDRALGHFRRYEKGEILGKLRDAGFEIAGSFHWNCFLFPIVWSYRKFMGRETLMRHGTNEEFLPPKWADWMLLQTLRFENLVSQYIRLPFGLSYFVVAKKKA